MDYLFGSISTTLVSGAGLTLIHFVWQAAIVAILLKLLLAIIPQKYLLTRYRLAIIALIVTVVFPCFTLYSLLQSPELVQSTIDYSAKAVRLLEELPELQEHTSPDIISNLSAQDSSNSIISSFVSENRMNVLFNVLIFWFVGCLLMLAKFIIDLNSTYKLSKEGIVPVNQQIDEIVRRLAQKYRLSRPIQILKSSMVNVPVVVGWLRPVVLLPIAISVGLEKAQLELIIAHELAHIKRMDFAVNVLQSLVQIFFFYHPAVHWINRVIRDEREYICDSMALNIVGNDDAAKLTLAKALLNIEELREGNFSLIAVAASGGRLKHRISHILEGEYRPATSIKTLLVSVFAFLFSLVAMASTVTFDKPNQVSMKTDISSVLQANIDKQRNTITPEELTKRPMNEVIEPEKSKSGLGAKEKDIIETAIIESIISANESETVLISTEDHSEELEIKAAKSIAKEKIKFVDNRLTSENSRLESSPPSVITKIKSGVEVSNKEGESNKRTKDFLSTSPTSLQNQKIDNLIVKKPKEVFKTASLDLNSVNIYSDPKAIFTPYPRYPRRAWNKMISQTVRVSFVINKDGKVESIKVLGKVAREFSREVKRKLRKWRYEPAMDKGKNIEHMASLEFIFKAPQEEKIVLISTGTHLRH